MMEDRDEFEDEPDAPRWDLSGLYAGLDAPEFLADQQALEEQILDFQAFYTGNVFRLTGAELGAAVAEYEEISALRTKINNYVALLEAEDRDNLSRTEVFRDWDSDIGAALDFFSQEIGAMKENDLMTKLVVPELAQYAPWIAQQRQQWQQHLPDKADIKPIKDEDLALEGWQRLYTETVSGLNVDGNPATPQERLDIGACLKRSGDQFAVIYNALTKDDVTEGQQKQLSPDHAVHLDNGLDPAIADAMFDAVKASFTRLSQRFYTWKIKRSGHDMMPLFELQGLSGDIDVAYGWEEARVLVLRAFRRLSPKFARIAQKFFDEEHIDAEPRNRKDTGSFMMSAGYGHLPFILVNFDNDADSVTCLGHELGHGIHQVLVEKAQSELLSEMSTHVAETASIFAEMLVLEELIANEKDPDARRGLMEKKVSNMLDNGLQQLSYYDFERRIHAERKNGALDFEKISDIWVETQKEYYGPAVVLDDYDRYFWMLVPHFFEMPFYVYSYSFAQMAVGALFQEYKKAAGTGPQAQEDFAAHYKAFLETGITRNFHEMFMPFGLDPGQPQFWESGLSLIEKSLEDLMKGDPVLKVVPPAVPPKPPAPGL